MEAKSKQEDCQCKLTPDMYNFHHAGGNGFNAYGGSNHEHQNFISRDHDGYGTSILQDIMELVTSLLMLNLMGILLTIIIGVMIEIMLNMIIMSIILMIVMKIKDCPQEKVSITFYSCQYQNPNCHVITV
ncbi:hypothetical protein M9H77_08039 [Catharanthus roseus]|uniref:Uncharacterized protein n=1 Tax=Catharanthus roseus TaxID=4058 RepID=A0ACC0BWM4_CATRO|nr:hypothetical protein M9H77_08039 [Catharanthus roseus]